MTKASLVVVGSGIKFISHLTTECKANIEQADKVLYLVNEPAMKEWIEKTNENAESLDEIYFRHELRNEAYQAITEYILAAVRQEQHVCVVFYGHPTVFALPALHAVKQAKKEGFYARILPGISAEDCLFADLLVDPGTCGCLSFEATDFLIRRRVVDNRSHLILWQVSTIGRMDHVQEHDNSKGAKVLLNYLLQFYPLEHTIILYSAAQYPGFEPIIHKIKLANLPEADFSRIATLYIPPAQPSTSDPAMLNILGLPTHK